MHSIEHLWCSFENSKTASFQQNLRELCDIKNPPTMASTSSATKSFITRCLSLSKAHYFYCIKTRVLSRTSLMLLWELKNAIISTNLRKLFDIKANTKISPTVASTSSATNSFITRCLSLSKAASKKHQNFITSSPRKIPHTVTSTSSATNSFITRCLSLSKARSYSSLWFRLRSATNSFIKRCLRVVEGTLFLLH